MNITLAEINAAESKPEASFNRGSVRVGREANGCDIAFDGSRWPMVSRQHAEFRCENGLWVIADLGSSYGVFVDGAKLAEPLPVKVGSKIQFGTDGPVLLVIWFEAAPGDNFQGDEPKRASVPSRELSVKAILPDTPSGASAPVPSGSWEMRPAPASPKPAYPPPALLRFEDEPARPPVPLSGSPVWLGRDPECTVVIDSSAGMVSRRHASVRLEGDLFVIEDNKSFNGTLVNDQRITAPTPLRHKDRIRLGLGGPRLRFDAPMMAAAGNGPGASMASVSIPAQAAAPINEDAPAPGGHTMVIERTEAETYLPKAGTAQPQLLVSATFPASNILTIGRNEANDIRLDGLQISNRHARLVQSAAGVVVEDLKSTNGVYVNGRRTARQEIGPHDAVQIGAFRITVDAAMVVNVYDTRSRTRVDVVDVTRVVKDSAGGGQLALLDGVSISIQPNEFVGVLGPSGAGKSMLIEVMNGIRPATSGSVRINGLDVHRHLDSLKQSIGYVPQEDIIHRELTVYRTLYYVAKLRLSSDISSAEVRQIVDEVLDVTGLAERRDVRVGSLSGGQRKRVSIAVELITKPSVIFLDEPTSGLDPAVEERIMRLFRRIAESGRTVIMTTHAMDNIRLFDKIAVLMGGKLVFYGKPDEALTYVGASSFKELFDKIEEPVITGVREHGETNRRQITERAAGDWKEKYRATPQFREYVQKPLSELGKAAEGGGQKKHRLGVAGAIGQWVTLSQRYFEVLLKDKLTLAILLAQAPIIALLTFFVMDADRPRDFVYFILALVAMWFGTSVAAREIIRERDVYKRERMVNLGLVPYLASKLSVIGIIVAVQCLLLFVPLKIFDLVGLMVMPGEKAGIPQLWAMLLTGAVGVGIGLLVSGMVRTSEMATGLVPLILIPQLLFSGIVGVPSGVSRVISMTMPAAWSFDTMKRFSTLDTLEPEGANERGKTKGLGLYKYVETENERTIAKARQDFEDYRRANESRFQDQPANSDPLSDPSSVSIKRIPDDLSPYVTFLHPWMNEVLNQLVLVLMFGLLAAATLVVLRLKDN